MQPNSEAQAHYIGLPMTPTVGRIVHLPAVLGLAGGATVTTCVAAIVTAIDPDGLPLVTVFSPLGAANDAARRLPATKDWHDPLACPK